MVAKTTVPVEMEFDASADGCKFLREHGLAILSHHAATPHPRWMKRGYRCLGNAGSGRSTLALLKPASESGPDVVANPDLSPTRLMFGRLSSTQSRMLLFNADIFRHPLLLEVSHGQGESALRGFGYS
jgi:hypothetical protein